VDLCPACGDKAGLLDAAHQFAKEGMRVLAMAYKEDPLMQRADARMVEEEPLPFAACRHDPIRAARAIEAVAGCRRAGSACDDHRDHAVTAQAIGARLGIGAGEDGSSSARSGLMVR